MWRYADPVHHTAGQNKNKDLDSNRNRYSSKRLCTNFGKVRVSISQDRNGEFEPQALKKDQSSINQDIKEKILPM